MKLYCIKRIVLIGLLFNTSFANCQVQEKKYQFNFIENAEKLNASFSEESGLIMSFRFWNKDKKTGNGGGWLIYKDGTKALNKLAIEFYPEENRPGRYFIDDLFEHDSVNPNVDTTMLKDFDIYLYIIDNKFLELRLNTDGEGAGKTYSYYETYPMDIVVYKREAAKDFFLLYGTYHAADEAEYLNAIKLISDFRKKTAIESNLSK